MRPEGIVFLCLVAFICVLTYALLRARQQKHVATTLPHAEAAFCKAGESLLFLAQVTEKDFVNLSPIDREYICINNEYFVNLNRDGNLFNREIAKENLLLFKQFADMHFIDYHLDCGTLLGVIREGNLIEHDSDVDVQIANNDRAKVLQLIPELVDMGFVPFRAHPSRPIALSLLRHGEYLDLYASLPELTYHLSLCPFLNTTFPVPAKYEAYLHKLYGPNWRTPLKNVRIPGGHPIHVVRKFAEEHKDDLRTRRQFLPFITMTSA